MFVSSHDLNQLFTFKLKYLNVHILYIMSELFVIMWKLFSLKIWEGIKQYESKR